MPASLPTPGIPFLVLELEPQHDGIDPGRSRLGDRDGCRWPESEPTKARRRRPRSRGRLEHVAVPLHVMLQVPELLGSSGARQVQLLEAFTPAVLRPNGQRRDLVQETGLPPAEIVGA